MEFLSSEDEVLVQVSQQYDKEMTVKKRKVPEPFKSLSPVFSSREDELLIEESQKHVELAAKKETISNPQNPQLLELSRVTTLFIVRHEIVG